MSRENKTGVMLFKRVREFKGTLGDLQQIYDEDTSNWKLNCDLNYRSSCAMCF